MQDFRNLSVWQKGHQFALNVYRHTDSFPRKEMFGITSQMRRAALSIPANIAEGSARQSDPEFKRFLHISIGSASEVQYYLLFCRDLGYLSSAACNELHEQVTEIRRMLASLISKCKEPSSRKLRADS